MTNTTMPAVYLGHGAPPLQEDRLWVAELKAWAGRLPRPKAILMVSAHWESAPLTIGATSTVPLIYDFGGFPRHYYEQQYAAPGAPELAASVRKLLNGVEPIAEQSQRGLDHGAYVPLAVMYPNADIPVLQISLPTQNPVRLLKIGEKLKTLRHEGVLIIGSGFMTHGLPYVNWSAGMDQAPPKWSAEFDSWAEQALRTGDLEALLRYRETAPALRYAHPTADHLLPMYVTLGAATRPDAPVQTEIEGFWLGLSKRSFSVT